MPPQDLARGVAWQLVDDAVLLRPLVARDRVEALGGHLHIESQDSGTRLDASFPTSNGSHG